MAISSRGGIPLRIAVLADPHGNLPALESVLAEAERLDAASILVAGDLVGYGPQPNEIVSLAMESGSETIRGNHDASAITGNCSRMNPLAALAARWTYEELRDESREYLAGLGTSSIRSIVNRKIGMFHGSPEDPDEYVLDETRALELLERSDCDIVICGHTHVPMIVRSEEKLFLNPGSVGQPRDGNPAASFAMLRIEALEAEMVRIGYDIASVQQMMLERGLPEFLAARLSRGV